MKFKALSENRVPKNVDGEANIHKCSWTNRHFLGPLKKKKHRLYLRALNLQGLGRTHFPPQCIQRQRGSSWVVGWPLEYLLLAQSQNPQIYWKGMNSWEPIMEENMVDSQRPFPSLGGRQHCQRINLCICLGREWIHWIAETGWTGWSILLYFVQQVILQPRSRLSANHCIWSSLANHNGTKSRPLKLLKSVGLLMGEIHGNPIFDGKSHKHTHTTHRHTHTCLLILYKGIDHDPFSLMCFPLKALNIAILKGSQVSFHFQRVNQQVFVGLSAKFPFLFKGIVFPCPLVTLVSLNRSAMTLKIPWPKSWLVHAITGK